MTYALVNIASTTTCIDRSRANGHLATVRFLFSLAAVSIFLMHIAGRGGGGGGCEIADHGTIGRKKILV